MQAAKMPVVRDVVLHHKPQVEERKARFPGASRLIDVNLVVDLVSQRRKTDDKNISFISDCYDCHDSVQRHSGPSNIAAKSQGHSSSKLPVKFYFSIIIDVNL
jgi:hypothetical protein